MCFIHQSVSDLRFQTRQPDVKASLEEASAVKPGRDRARGAVFAVSHGYDVGCVEDHYDMAHNAFSCEVMTPHEREPARAQNACRQFRTD